MARARLTEAERAERKRRAWTDAGYQHYDTSQGFGSFDEWVRAAEALAGDRSVLRPGGQAMQGDADLALFGLERLPADIAGLKRAFRNSLFVFHPDHGGTDDQARAAYAAFGRLSKHY